MQVVSGRLNALILAVLHNLSQIGKPGIGSLILDGDGCGKTIVVRNAGPGLTCGHGVILQLDVAIFKEDGLKLELGRSTRPAWNLRLCHWNTV
jgi:hypothetical protein